MINRKIWFSVVVIAMFILSAVAVWAEEERNDEEIDRNFIEDPDMENEGTGDNINKVTPNWDVVSYDGIYVYTDSDYSPGVDVCTYGDDSHGVDVYTDGDDSHGVDVYTNGDYSDGVYVYTYGDDSHGVDVYTDGDYSDGVYVSTSGPDSDGVGIFTYGDYSQGVDVYTYGDDSHGVDVYTDGDYSQGVDVYTEGDDSHGVDVYTDGDYSDGVYVCTEGDYSDGVYVSTSGPDSDGFIADTTGDYSEGALIYTDGYGSDAYYAQTYDENSKGVLVYTYGENSDGVYAYAYGDDSYGVCAISQNDHAIVANTRRSDGRYGLYTDDSIYVGGKLEVVGSVDPIITECFSADPDVDYEVGDVVILNKKSAKLEPCTIANDTKVVGVVGPTLVIEDSEISVVIMGYRGARPDQEYSGIQKEQLKQLEARESSLQQKQIENNDSEIIEELKHEIGLLKIDIEEAESVTRQVVRVKADASYAPIEIGDLLTTSPTHGHAMKAQPVQISGIELYRPGTLIGKAMEPLESGTGMIEVFVTLQ